MSSSSLVITQQDKEHLKSLFSEFLSNKEYRDCMNTSWLNHSEMMITLCASHGKFDFSVVLEHFSDLMSALKYLGRPKEFMTWKDFMIYYAAYTLLDCPLLNLTVVTSNEFKFMKKQLHCLFFASYPSDKEKRELKTSALPKNIQSALAKDAFSQLLQIISSEQPTKQLIANIAYTALENEKWNIFAGLHAQYDLAGYVNMENLFEFWSTNLLTRNYDTLDRKKTLDFNVQWLEPEKYPLHRMMIEYGRERCVPPLYNHGLLLPDVIEYLWNNGISFDVPLTAIYGWEKVTFPAFAAYFGSLSGKIDLIPIPKYQQSGEEIFRKNVKSAAFFNEYSTKYPRKITDIKSELPVKKAKGELTDEQKVRLINDEAAGIVFSKNKKTLQKYASCLTERNEWRDFGYKVPDFVTAIGASAFSELEAIQVKTIILPEGLTKIGSRAFEYVKLENVTFPSSLKTIEKEAFVHTNLKELLLPDGIVKIGDTTFSNCRNLKKVSLPDSLIELGNDIFRWCSSLTDVRLPANLKSIPNCFFLSCAFENFAVPNGIEKIGVSAFRECQKLTSIFLPDSVVELDNAVFYNCSSLREVRLSANLKSIPYLGFASCTSLESIIIPDSVQKIMDSAFAGCSSLRRVEVPKGIKVCKGAFRDNSPELQIIYRKPVKK